MLQPPSGFETKLRCRNDTKRDIAAETRAPFEAWPEQRRRTAAAIRSENSDNRQMKAYCGYDFAGLSVMFRTCRGSA